MAFIAAALSIWPDEEPGNRLVQNHLLVFLVLRNAQVEDHVRAVEARLDGAEIVLRGGFAHARLGPVRQFLELRNAVGVEAGLADGDVDIRLRRLLHIGEEGVGGFLDLGVGLGVDAAAPAAERCERRMVDAVDRVRAGVLGAGFKLAGVAVQHLFRTRQDRRADLVDDLRRCRVDGERADIAPVDRQGATAGDKQAARVADIEVDFVRRAVFRRLLEDVERLAEGLVIDQRLHRARVEERALAGALRLDEAARDRGDEPVGLRIALLRNAGPVIRRAVAVQILAVQRLGGGKIVVPGLRRLQVVRLEDVGAVIHHVEVAVQGQHIDLAVILLREIAEEAGDVVLLQVLVLGDTVGEILKEATGDIVDHPLRREHRRIDRIGAARPVRQQLGVEIRERHGDDVDLGAGQLLEFGSAPLQRLGDLRPGEGHDIHRHTVIRTRERRPRRKAERHRDRACGKQWL